jgi:hypothetical protein
LPSSDGVIVQRQKLFIDREIGVPYFLWDHILPPCRTETAATPLGGSEQQITAYNKNSHSATNAK